MNIHPKVAITIIMINEEITQFKPRRRIDNLFKSDNYHFGVFDCQHMCMCLSKQIGLGNLLALFRICHIKRSENITILIKQLHYVVLHA